MILAKITAGFVVQHFDTDRRKFTCQSFVAGESPDYETFDGVPVDPALFEVDGKEAELDFDMVQPSFDF